VTVVLDAGALIAIERGDRDTAALLKVSLEDGQAIVVPAGVVAQVWREGQRQVRVTRLLNASEVSVEDLTDTGARAAGTLCGHSGTSDVIDASVVITARRHQAPVISSDRDDLSRLDPAVSIIDC
jgi:hypothetical protein